MSDLLDFDAIVAEVEQAIGGFSAATNLPRREADALMLYANRLAFIRWLRGRLQQDLATANGHGRTVQRRLADVAAEQERLERLLSAVQRNAQRGYGDWVEAYLVQWAVEGAS